MQTGFQWADLIELFYTDTGEPAGVEKLNLVGDPDYLPPVLNELACPVAQVDRTPRPTFAGAAVCQQSAPRTSSATLRRQRDANPNSPTFNQWLTDANTYTTVEAQGVYLPTGQSDAALCPLPTPTATGTLWLLSNEGRRTSRVFYTTSAGVATSVTVLPGASKQVCAINTSIPFADDPEPGIIITNIGTC